MVLGVRWPCDSVDIAPTVPSEAAPSAVVPSVAALSVGVGSVLPCAAASPVAVLSEVVALLVSLLLIAAPALMSGNASEGVPLAPLVGSVTVVSVVAPSTLGVTVVSVLVAAVASAVVEGAVGKVSAGGISVTVEITPDTGIDAVGRPVPLLFVADAPGECVVEPRIGVPGSAVPEAVVTGTSTGVTIVVATGAASPETISASVGVRKSSAMTRSIAVMAAVEADARMSPLAAASGTVVVADRLRNAVCPSAEYMRPVTFTETDLLVTAMLSNTKEPITADSVNT